MAYRLALSVLLRKGQNQDYHSHHSLIPAYRQLLAVVISLPSGMDTPSSHNMQDGLSTKFSKLKIDPCI
ncbi:hypothetical protein RvY_08254-2 [Ramazzottius varieornatus]|uniref:Uncharacterized protein n=1 Tax=Ramazzottius varieornatus TaxID=947166 RepID=A0A1D1V5B1_RAMVA|nr:hypothetical protein RvY_08254-2 [Ramazzottius varieornatus]